MKYSDADKNLDLKAIKRLFVFSYKDRVKAVKLLINYDMSYSDVRKVWWLCKDCNYKYFMSTKLRIYYQHRNMISCPHCKGLRQKKIHFF